MSDAYLQLTDIVKRYPGTDRPAVSELSIGVKRGEFISLLGPSGCGKTTALRLVAGLIEPSSGRIDLDGRELTHTPVHRRGMGLVFQNYALFPHLDVEENIAFGLNMRKISKSDVKRRVGEVLDLVQLGHLKKRRIKQLSGGQQQRVALARALVVEPKVLLLDEPLSNLDAKLRDTMRDEIRSIQQKIGITTVFVTHDQDEALATSDRIAVMSEGNIEQVGTPEEIYEHPANPFVANFIGRANIFEGTITETSQGVATVQLEKLGAMTAVDDHRQLGPCKLMVRPHRMGLEQCEPPQAHGQVESMVYVGDSVEYTVQLGSRTASIQSVSTGDPHLKPGTPVRISWRTTDAVVLKEKSG
jgi:putative spermidine/putrescine transport system ATP-binding protein